MDAVRQLIIEKAQEAGENLASLSRRIGRNHAYLQQFIERGVPRHLPEEPREKLAAALGVDAELLRGTPAPGALPGVAMRQTLPAQHARTGADPIELGPTVPLLGQGAAGKDGLFARVADVLAPASLARVRGAYAVYVVGESMQPRYEPGEIVFVDPNRPVNRGHYVVVQIAGEEGGAPAGYIKRYVGRDARSLKLEQLNPRKALSYPVGRVVSVHRIIMGGDG